MSNDKKVVSLVTPAAREASEKRKLILEHLVNMNDDIINKGHKFMLVTVDPENFTSLLTDLDLYHANYVVDKLKLEFIDPISDEFVES